MTALAHLPGVCSGIPENLVVDEENYGPCLETGFFATTCSHSCPGLVCHVQPWLHHGAIGAEYETFRGHFVAMFRQPEQRIISYHNMKSQPDSFLYSPDFEIKFPTLRGFAEHMEGGVTRMLTEEGGSPCIEGSILGGKVPAHQLALAKQRLREGFVFIGITEQWDLSICLLHAMLGGKCRAVEFEDSRPGVASTDDHSYDTSELQGFVDEADGEIYQLALDIFNENLAKYQASNESCGTCWEQAAQPES